MLTRAFLDLPEPSVGGPGTLKEQKLWKDFILITYQYYPLVVWTASQSLGLGCSPFLAVEFPWQSASCLRLVSSVDLPREQPVIVQTQRRKMRLFFPSGICHCSDLGSCMLQRLIGQFI